MDSVAKMSQLHKSHSCQNVTVVKKSLCHKSHCCKNITGQKIGQIRPPTVGNGPPWKLATPTVGISPPWKLIGKRVKKVLDPHRGK